jgi:hypothetical protein
MPLRNELPTRPNDQIVARKRDRARRAQQVNEADEIYTSLILQRGLVGDLIHASAKRISDPAEAADVRLDLYMIVRDLAARNGTRKSKSDMGRLQAPFCK